MFIHRMSRGIEMKDKYPADAKVYMKDRRPGMGLPSLIGNTLGFLIVGRALKEAFEATGVALECLPFTLFNHKKREASRDYFIINPLGTFDCLNMEKSEIDYSKESPGEILGVDRVVLSAKKLASAPDFFRIQEVPHAYIISARLAAKLQALQPTNFYVTQLEVAE
jgi:hypothetical protein